ncbi:RidA family protein [Sphingobacteriales bacterium UPWRP_1]|nr:reactive intermediate/imine deaminase [Sphingobacteriales bacterium TSM_CSM]PSJ71946.1 RidA family protein [Sphingobacteriales bacterium UPWRP_1]
MAKKILFTENAPAPIGPYNQAVWAGNLLFISGQIAINPETGELVTEDGIEEETRQVMENLRAILAAAGLTFANVVKTSIFLEDMDNFNRVNELYGQYFDDTTAPARETIEVSALPKDVNVEISMIAVKDS